MFFPSPLALFDYVLGAPQTKQATRSTKIIGTLRGHMPSDLAFRSHLGSNLELYCLSELGAVLLAMSGWQLDLRLRDHCWICGYADHLSYVCPDNCCWICGYADHLCYVCPDNCCWICGDRDHWSNQCLQQPAPTPLQAFEEQGPLPLGTFPPGSYPAQQQRLFENLPKQLKDAYRKEANGYGPMSCLEKNAYDHLAQIFSQMEATNTWIEMCVERRPGKKRDREFATWHSQLAEHMKEWEDFAKEPVKVLGSVS